MKLVILSLALGLLLAAPATAENQQEMNQRADREYQVADKELNRIWKELLTHLTPGVKDKLITSQQQWIKFRDAEAAAKSSIFEGGSMAPMIYSYSLKRTTETRIEELKDWLKEAQSR